MCCRSEHLLPFPNTESEFSTCDLFHEIHRTDLVARDLVSTLCLWQAFGVLDFQLDFGVLNKWRWWAKWYLLHEVVWAKAVVVAGTSWQYIWGRSPHSHASSSTEADHIQTHKGLWQWAWLLTARKHTKTRVSFFFPSVSPDSWSW